MNNQRKIAFLGPLGTFSEEAARKAFVNEPTADFIPYTSIQDVLEATQNGEADVSVVPVENSVEGTVNVTLDWLAHEGDLVVIGEQIVPVSQNLIGLPDAQLTDIHHVSSHPQALAQCRGYLRSLKEVLTHSTDSTAGAIEQVANQGNPSYAAIGTAFAAHRYGLKIIASNIQDFADNTTRFFVVTQANKYALTIEDHPYKTSLLITLSKDHTGALVYILNVFSAVGINLTRIESRPTRKSLGSYWFFVDIEGHKLEEKVRRAIQAIGTFGHEVRILGSYPDSLK